MRDPRLVEIDFLMAVDTARGLHLRSPLSDSDSGARQAGETEPTRFGFDAARFRDMVIDFVLRDFLVSDHRQQLRDRGTNEETFLWARRQLTSEVVEGGLVKVHISHAGRVHLWNLRDALLRDPDLDPLGLRTAAAWERDLFIRLRFANADEPLSVIFLDLDHFGLVNKAIGWVTGTAVLRVAFDVIKNLVGSRGLVYRCGGEEVGVLLPDTTQVAAARLAEELRAVIEKEVIVQVPLLHGPQTASIGVKAFIAPAENDAVVDLVDALVREAKDAGRNRVVTAS